MWWIVDRLSRKCNQTCRLWENKGPKQKEMLEYLNIQGQKLNTVFGCFLVLTGFSDSPEVTQQSF